MVPRTVGVLALLLIGSALGGLDHDPLAPPAQRAADMPRGAQGPSPSHPASAQSVSSLWRSDYSERFPGCVPAVLWPGDEQPVAVVTMTPDGRVDRVAIDHQQRLVRPVPAAARTIGACR